MIKSIRAKVKEMLMSREIELTTQYDCSGCGSKVLQKCLPNNVPPSGTKTTSLVKPHTTFPWASQVVLSGKESVSNVGAAGDAGSTPEMGRFSEEGNGHPLQYS